MERHLTYAGNFDDFLNTPVFAVVFSGDSEETLYGTLVKPGFHDVHGIVYFLQQSRKDLLEPLDSDATVYSDDSRKEIVGMVFAENKTEKLHSD